MIKKSYIVTLLGTVAIFIYLFSKPLYNNILDTSYSIKHFIVQKIDENRKFLNRYLNQAKTIKNLQEQIALLKPKAVAMNAYKKELDLYLKNINLKKFDPHLSPVKILTYEQLNNPNRVYLDFPRFDESKNYGLISQNRVAGVIKSKASKPLGILIYDPKAIFSVLIGKDEIEGVSFGNGKNLLIKFIPSYKNPKVGDEVITSGYDGLFYYGIKVGRVISIQKRLMYKVAFVKPYLPTKKPKYLYAVDVK
ncbi:MAG: rod shape-determining protein MreC [Sulfurospirillum sp.]|nr:MAG: rod shape-determining protein MreC [Sulfurospirillum sp.]